MDSPWAGKPNTLSPTHPVPLWRPRGSPIISGEGEFKEVEDRDEKSEGHLFFKAKWWGIIFYPGIEQREIFLYKAGLRTDWGL